jgi:hypothetical protein
MLTLSKIFLEKTTAPSRKEKDWNDNNEESESANSKKSRQEK